jgi:hypothetical protein
VLVALVSEVDVVPICESSGPLRRARSHSVDPRWSVLAKTVAAKSSAIWPGARIPQLSVGPPRNAVARLGGNHFIGMATRLSS